MSDRFIGLKCEEFQNAWWNTCGNPEITRVMINLLASACYKPSNYGGETLKRGQVFTSLGNDKFMGRFMELNVSVPRHRIKYALEKLEEHGEIRIDGKPGQYTVITIINYDKYLVAANDVGETPPSKPKKEKKAEKPSKQPPVDEGYDDTDWDAIIGNS